VIGLPHVIIVGMYDNGWHYRIGEPMTLVEADKAVRKWLGKPHSLKVAFVRPVDHPDVERYRNGNHK
jgi:hypothetical protein